MRGTGTHHGVDDIPVIVGHLDILPSSEDILPDLHDHRTDTESRPERL